MDIVPGGRHAGDPRAGSRKGSACHQTLARSLLSLQTGRTPPNSGALGQIGTGCWSDPTYGAARKLLDQSAQRDRAAPQAAAFPRQALHAQRSGSCIRYGQDRAVCRQVPGDIGRLWSTCVAGACDFQAKSFRQLFHVRNRHVEHVLSHAFYISAHRTRLALPSGRTKRAHLEIPLAPILNLINIKRHTARNTTMRGHSWPITPICQAQTPEGGLNR